MLFYYPKSSSPCVHAWVLGGGGGGGGGTSMGWWYVHGGGGGVRAWVLQYVHGSYRAPPPNHTQLDHLPVHHLPVHHLPAPV